MGQSDPVFWILTPFLANKTHWHVPGSPTADSKFWEPGTQCFPVSVHRKRGSVALVLRLPRGPFPLRPLPDTSTGGKSHTSASSSNRPRAASKWPNTKSETFLKCYRNYAWTFN